MGAADDEASLFAGPGPIRGHYLRVDWASTPLGPVRTWSPVLRTMVRAGLASRFPIVIHWGADLVSLYNDAFAQSLGGKHPAALGQPARMIWEEAWERVGARLDQVMREGDTVWAQDEQEVLYRNGYPEECYFTFSHSPIIDLDGATAGVFTVSTETTAAVLYERRMRVVRELGGLSIAEAGSTIETCRAVLRVLATARETMPFAVAFLTKGNEINRVGHYGLGPGGDIPGLTDLAPSDPGGAVNRALATVQRVEVTDLRERFPGALLPGPLGPLTPDAALALPLAVAGGADPIGALVLGVNPYRPLGDEYRGFSNLMGRQLLVALTDTEAYQIERLRAQVLQDMDRAKMEFFQNVSHELRTPLTLLLAPLQDLLAAAADRSEAERSDLRSAVRAAERLRSMVDALLDFSEAEAGTLNPHRQLVDLAMLTADTASMFRSTAEHAGLRFTVDVPSVPVTARVDRGMWATIVTNLVSNAVKYTLDGSVEIRLSTAGADAVLSVADTGIGIDPEQQNRVFERFYRARTDGDTVGAGIGLAVTADLVRANGGRLALASIPRRGSTFTVTVPIDRSSIERAPVPDERTAGEHVHGQRADTGIRVTAVRPRVLLVEDDEDLRGYLTRLLTQDGWTVHGVPDAEAALADTVDDAGIAPFDVVITDVMLPGRSGLELVRALRESPRTERSPIIVVTARHGDGATGEGLAAGADDYITKPFSSSELLARVRATYELNLLREAAVDEAHSVADHLRGALDSNRTIGTAVGILMVNHRFTAAQAFQLLVLASQHQNRKLREIAADVTFTGELSLRPELTERLIARVSDGRVKSS